jgi:predicted dehydrogenase
MEIDMNAPKIAPVLVGQGMAGQAILKSLSIVSQIDTELCLLPARLVQRGTPVASYLTDEAINVLFIANPSGLHAGLIAEGSAAGFSAIAVDKPVCVRVEELPILQKIQVPVTVFHGYRAMWGTRTVKAMIEAGELGDIFCFESRYWQSSSAQATLTGTPEKRPWKNDLNLNGPSDTLTDLGSHVVDVCLHLMADMPIETKFWVSYQNSLAPFRDTHVHMFLKFASDKRALASISKTVHGATNNFEYTVIGTKASATWRFLQPDEVEFGSGNRTSIIRRHTSSESSGSLPFHGLGWLEGYVEITRQTLRRIAGLDSVPVPTLEESLAVMNVILNTR